MPLKKLALKSGVNRENTRYTTEGGWYECDKIRFRQGTPEKIGGWLRISSTTFLGVCRSLWNWVTLGSQNLLGVGTNLKFYIERGGAYFDITPLRATVTLGTNPFATDLDSPIVTVTDAAGGFSDGDFVTFSGATTVAGLNLNGEYQITVIGADYTITASANANATTTGGGSTVSAAYQLSVGPAYVVPLTGWGAGAWGSGTWGIGSTSTDSLRLWNQFNFGEDLIYGPRGGALYYWDASVGTGSRGVLVSSLAGASDVPVIHNSLTVSDISRFVLVFGTNEIGSTAMDPLLIRWSDQESIVDWSPLPTNQAGSIRLSHGSSIVTTLQARQEILVWTDSSVYAMQYVGAPIVWQSSLVGDNISIASPNAVAYANGVAYWMGVDKFYKYDGRVQTLKCDLRQFIYTDINSDQFEQVFAGTNEGFNEVWWFYCTSGETDIGRYVVFNYAEEVWYYGSMQRTAWLDSALRRVPLAATYSNNIVLHETGVDDGTGADLAAIPAYITSSEFDLDDGHNFAFVWRVLPDITFSGSTATNPAVTMYMLPMQNSGSGYNDPTSVGGTNNATVTRTAVLPVESFTGQIFTRVRGRQLAMKVESTGLGVTWQLGSPRLDMRPDGRR